MEANRAICVLELDRVSEGEIALRAQLTAGIERQGAEFVGKRVRQFCEDAPFRSRRDWPTRFRRPKLLYVFSDAGPFRAVLRQEVPGSSGHRFDLGVRGTNDDQWSTAPREDPPIRTGYRTQLRGVVQMAA